MNTTETIYKSIIEDVVKKTKQYFIDAGCDESTVKEFQQVHIFIANL
jgi:hypothetical protein